jgi:hypothetical protein
MRHQDLTINHRLESWIYPDAASRIAASGFVAGDIGRISYQSNTGDYWRLLSTTPTWKRLNGSAAAIQSGSASPAATTSVNPGIMLGLGAAAKITPSTTGKVFIVVSGTLTSYVASKQSAAALRWGTGSPPAYGASGNTGTVFPGNTAVFGGDTIETSGFSLSGLIPSAVIGTQLWFDIQLYVDAGGNGQALGVSITAVELP